MLALTINDIEALVNIVFGLVVMVLEFQAARACTLHRWVYYLKAFASLCLSVTFFIALFSSLTGGDGLVPPVIGRPAVTITLAALFVGAIMQRYSRRGDCK